MFSPREEKIIKLLSLKKRSLEDVSDILFKDDLTAHFDKTITISNSIHRINRKCEHYQLPWTISKDKKAGEKSKFYKAISNDNSKS